MTGVAFLSQSYRVPTRVVSNAELEERLSLGRGVIERLTGIRNRRFIADGESLQSLAVDACQSVLTEAGCDPASVDSLIFYTDSPPLMPEGPHHRKMYYDVSAHIQYLLRERGVPLACECVAIGGSCVSFLLSLQMAAGMIRSGMKKNILVVGAACNSLFLENTDKNVAMSFGDAAVASLLAESRDDALVGIYCLTDGRGFEAGCYPDYENLFIDRKRVAEFAPLAFRDAMAGLLARTGLSLEDFNTIIPHQAGIKIIERGMALAGIPPEKVYLCLQDFGNTGAPAVQLALARAIEEGRVRDGDLVGLVAFGTGWHCGAAAIRIQKDFHKTIDRTDSPARKEDRP
jgi:3-oxoacyl-[acyl-carrier-protein] synthase-3